MRIITYILIGALAGVATDFPARGQTRIDLTRQARSVDFSQAGSTKPSQTGTSLPAVCSAGETFILLSAVAGQNLYICTSTDTWSLASGTMSAGSGIQIAGNTVSVEDTLIPRYYTGSGQPGFPCTTGRDIYLDTAGSQFYRCTATDVWTALSGSSSTAAGAMRDQHRWWLGGGEYHGMSSAPTLTTNSGLGGVGGITAYHPRLEFAAGEDRGFTAEWRLPSNYAGNAEILLAFQANDSGAGTNITWAIATKCWDASGAGINPESGESWSAPVVTNVPKPGWNIEQALSITPDMTACAANEYVSFAVWRDGDASEAGALDDYTAAARLTNMTLEYDRNVE